MDDLLKLTFEPDGRAKVNGHDYGGWIHYANHAFDFDRGQVTIVCKVPGRKGWVAQFTPQKWYPATYIVFRGVRDLTQDNVFHVNRLIEVPCKLVDDEAAKSFGYLLKRKKL